jgi:hypothetical protein
MSTTMHDMARLAGVSITTVSNVVNDFPHIRQETRQSGGERERELGLLTGNRRQRVGRVLCGALALDDRDAQALVDVARRPSPTSASPTARWSPLP